MGDFLGYLMQFNKKGTPTMPLNNKTIENAKPRNKQYKLYDSKGLFILIKPNGAKYWRFKYRYANKEKVYAMGVYPEVSLKEARELQDELRAKVRKGIDPMSERKVKKRELTFKHKNTFKDIATSWMKEQERRWSKKHYATTRRRLEKNLFPVLGNRPISELSQPEVLDALKKIQDRDAIDLAHRIKYTIGQILRYAVVKGLASRDFTPDLKSALETRPKQHHTRLHHDDLPDFLKALENYDGEPQTAIATKLLLHTLVRTGELRKAKWSEFNIAEKTWRIPAETMKMKTEHIVPLSNQVIELLRQQMQFSGNSIYVFPGRSNLQKCMSENTILGCIKRLGYQDKTTGHGFRGLGSTTLYENDYPNDWIERQLAHLERNKVRAAYDFAKFLSQRRKMMQWWSNYLDKAAQTE